MSLKNLVKQTSVSYDKIPNGSLLMFAGRPKTGKSTAAATFSATGKDGVLILDFEGGSTYLSKGSNYIPITSLAVPHRLIPGTTDWEVIPPIERGLTDTNGNAIESFSYKEVVDSLTLDWDSSPFTCLAIDSVTAFYRMMESRVLSDLVAHAKATDSKYKDATSLGDFGYSEGYNLVKSKVRERILYLKDITRRKGYMVIVGHHRNTLVIDSEDKKKMRMQIKLDLPDGMADQLSQMCDFIGTFKILDSGAYVCEVNSRGIEGTSGTRFKPIQGKTIQFRDEGPNSLYNMIMKDFNKYEDNQIEKETANG